jgi:hypothetical protein
MAKGKKWEGKNEMQRLFRRLQIVAEPTTLNP